MAVLQNHHFALPKQSFYSRMQVPSKSLRDFYLAYNGIFCKGCGSGKPCGLAPCHLDSETIQAHSACTVWRELARLCPLSQKTYRHVTNHASVVASYCCLGITMRCRRSDIDSGKGACHYASRHQGPLPTAGWPRLERILSLIHI